MNFRGFPINGLWITAMKMVQSKETVSTRDEQLHAQWRTAFNRSKLICECERLCRHHVSAARISDIPAWVTSSVTGDRRGSRTLRRLKGAGRTTAFCSRQWQTELMLPWASASCNSDLGYRKLCMQWFPRMFTEAPKQADGHLPAIFVATWTRKWQVLLRHSHWGERCVHHFKPENKWQ
jgi:hypothetical protein